MESTDFKVMRIRARLTPWQLSQLSGVHPSRILEMERGIRPVEIALFKALEAPPNREPDLWAGHQ